MATDGIRFDWSGSDTALLNIATRDGGVLEFDPAALEAGHYPPDVRVSDGALASRNWVVLTVLDGVPAGDGDFDFEIAGLARAGDTARVLIPLSGAIASDEDVYRQYTPGNGVIRDPRGVAVAELTPEPQVEPAAGDGSGGGLLHPFWVLLALGGWFGRRGGKKQ